MPMKLHVGLPDSAWWHDRRSDPSRLDPEDLALLEEFQEPVPLRFEMDLLSVWGTAELERQAAFLALEGRLLPQHEFDEFSDVNLTVRYYDRVEEGERLPFLHLLYAAWAALYLPLPEAELPIARNLERGELGSLVELGNEMEMLADALEVPLGAPTLLARLKGEMQSADAAHAYGAERFLCAAIWETCRAGMQVRAPVYSSWYYRLKPLGLPFGDRASSYWGFGYLSAAGLEDHGRFLVVEFEGGYRYRLPTAFARSLNSGEPPGAFVEAKRVSVSEFGTDLEVHLSNRESLELSAVSILLGCEPDFEHFGGFSEESAQNIRRWHATFGPFRIAPTGRERSRT